MGREGTFIVAGGTELKWVFFWQKTKKHIFLFLGEGGRRAPIGGSRLPVVVIAAFVIVVVIVAVVVAVVVVAVLATAAHTVWNETEGGGRRERER